MIRKSSIVLLFTLVFVLSSFSQNEINYKLIDSLGKNFTNSLRNGNIEHLENSKPPEGTWTYDRLVEFKEALKNYPDDLTIGSFVEPSNDKVHYAFNVFALKRIDERNWEYYYAAIVNIDISGDSYKIENTYLFTEKEPLKSWWAHIFGFYEGEAKKDIPKEFVFPVCPPPPFKED